MISLVSAIVCISDKLRAIRGIRRISERTLFLLSAFGGGIAMYITMRVIHHKTLHKRFMIGIPIIIISEALMILLWLLK